MPDDGYVELRLPGDYLAIWSRKAANYIHGGKWKAAETASAILEYEVDDAEAESGRVSDFVTDWIRQATLSQYHRSRTRT